MKTIYSNDQNSNILTECQLQCRNDQMNNNTNQHIQLNRTRTALESSRHKNIYGHAFLTYMYMYKKVSLQFNKKYNNL